MTWTDDMRERALAEAAAWKGTRHAHRIAVPGRGIDCIRFVCRVLAAAGALESVSLPTYPTAWGMASAESKLGVAFAACCDAIRIPVEEWEPEFGDICIWAVGGNSNHCGVYLGKDVWHVSTNSPCGPLLLASARKKMQEAIRLTAFGFRRPPTSIRLLEL